MRNLIFLYSIFGLFFILSSCSYKQDQVLFEQKSSTPDSILRKNTANISNYRIRPQDILQVINIQNSKSLVDLSAANANNGISLAAAQQGDTYQVEDDGTIALTGIGRVQVAGLTRVEARKYIEGLYREKFLNDPIFELKITNLKVTIFGEIKSPGNFPLIKDRTTLIEAIGEAGGLTEKADEKHIQIIRGSQQNPTTETIDLSNIRSLTDPRAILQNNDIIYISQNKKAIRNNNITNFSVVIQPALILFNTALIIFTLVRH